MEKHQENAHLSPKDLLPYVKIGLQNYGFLIKEKGPGEYRFREFADAIESTFESPESRDIAAAFRSVPDGLLTLHENSTLSVEYQQERLVSLARLASEADILFESRQHRIVEESFGNLILSRLEKGNPVAEVFLQGDDAHALREELRSLGDNILTEKVKEVFDHGLTEYHCVMEPCADVLPNEEAEQIRFGSPSVQDSTEGHIPN